MIDEIKTFLPLHIAVLTVSDTRNMENDLSGNSLVDYLTRAGHVLSDRALVRDNVPDIKSHLEKWIEDPGTDVVISTGGTGVTGRDVTPEAFSAVIEKSIPGFGELFRMLSYQKIGTSTIQSRALAGLAKSTYLFALPGSRGAVRDAWEDVLKYQLDNRHRPCNFAELIPRLQEK
ncbi:molybdenum cofactor biosynthesis protein B [Gluconobacter morbifer]|uniref:Molybdenum cofactor biosynthesis protein B n=1 Tax=Gluconobacter morbifer G707 TaxID=1088869 RepID=G6XHH9_9PROT|nr:molybdenum cofactor biosynthesis protein B [Gluconobacter morbifer]EHH69637.1 molybdopterin binding domain-containing protein [Gluconobacter morbifer G707]